MLPWKLRKCRILPVNQNLSLIYFPLAKFQLVSCNPSLVISWQMTYTQKLPKLCSATLNNQFHLDLQWWHKFLSEWHGVSFWLFPGLSPEADIELSSDAAGSLGYGAFLRGLWFTGSWSPSQAQQSIAYKELFPVVAAAHICGDMWCRTHVLFHSDNDAVVHVLNSRTSKIPLHLVFIAASSIVSC